MIQHLKNVKKQEIQEKVKKIMKTAGIDDDDIIPLSAAELEEEFAPEEYDRMMKKAFDEKYYNEYKKVYKKVFKDLDTPVLYNINFGHSVPRTVLPYGISTTVDYDNKTLTINEPIFEK